MKNRIISVIVALCIAALLIQGWKGKSAIIQNQTGIILPWHQTLFIGVTVDNYTTYVEEEPPSNKLSL